MSLTQESPRRRLDPRSVPPMLIQMREWRNRVHRGPRVLSFDEAATYRIVGIRKWGKGVLGECIATHILKQGGTVLDWSSATATKEALAWLGSEYVDEVCFIVGSNCRIDTDIPVYKFDEWTIDLIPKHKVQIMLDYFFEKEDHYFYALMKLMEKLRHREAHRAEEGIPDAILIREAQRYVKASMAISHIKNQRDAEMQFLDFHDEATQSGFSVILDSKTVNTINKNVRDTSNYTFYKNMGAADLPDSMHHLFNEYASEDFRSLAKYEFILHTSFNSVGFGINQMVPWHVVRGKPLTERYKIHPIFEGATVIPSAEVGRPRVRKVTKQIHDHIIAQRAADESGEEIAHQIQAQFGVNLSAQAVLLEARKHNGRICGFCTFNSKPWEQASV